jgi:hypothetical protein
MRPRSSDGLHLADDSFFKIESALPPPEDLSDRRLPFDRTVNGVSHQPMVKVNFAVPASRFESEAPASLAQAAHLQNLRRGEFVEVANQGMARVNPLGGRAGGSFKGGYDCTQPASKPAIAAVGRDQFNILFARLIDQRFIHRILRQADDFERGKMLPGMDRLFDRDRRVAFHNEEVEVFPHENVNGLSQGADNAGFNFPHRIKYGQRSVLEDRIEVEDEQSCFHKGWMR